MCIRDRYIACNCITDKTLNSRISNDFWLQIFTLKNKVMVFHGADPSGVKIVVDGSVLEKVSNFEYLGQNVSYVANKDVVKKLHKFNRMRKTVRRNLKSTSKETRLSFPHFSTSLRIWP